MASGSSSNCVHLTIILNDIQPEYFEYMETLRYTPTNPLIRYLEQAADKNSQQAADKNSQQAADKNSQQAADKNSQQAADNNSPFKFSATYFPDMGYFIDSINGLAGKWDTDQTYWAILNSDFEEIGKGVSSYIPDNGERLIFKFTKSQPLTGDNC